VHIKTIIQKARVPLGFLFAIVFFLICRPDWFYLTLGFPLVILGLWMRIWAAGHIRKSREITQSGPYRFTRNPLYLGSFLLGLGFTLQSGLLFLPLIFVVLFFAIYYPVMRQEEWELQKVFKNEYTLYRERVALFLPLPNKCPASGIKFSISLAWKNQEYNSIIGAVAAECILILKLFFPVTQLW